MQKRRCISGSRESCALFSAFERVTTVRLHNTKEQIDRAGLVEVGPLERTHGMLCVPWIFCSPLSSFYSPMSRCHVTDIVHITVSVVNGCQKQVRLEDYCLAVTATKGYFNASPSLNPSTHEKERRWNEEGWFHVTRLHYC